MDNKKRYEEFGSVFELIRGQIDKLPIPALKKKQMLEKVIELKTLTMDSREPRIALVGRRGSGKSSLINAMFGSEKQYVSPVKAGTGKGSWLWYPNEQDRKIRLLDSRGLGESENPDEEFTAESPLEELKLAVTEEQPDVLLFLIKAKETDARIEEDLIELANLRRQVKKEQNYDVPVICVVTQVDELDPPHYKQVPLDGHPKKKKNIDEAVSLMQRRFEEADIPLITVIPVCSYLDFDEDGNIEYDMRWNINLLAEFLLEALPSQAQLRTAKAMKSRAVKKKYAGVIVGMFTGITGLIGAEPIPLADFPVLTALQGLMILIIGYLADKELSVKSAGEFVTALGINAGIGLLVREGVRAAVRFLPGAGSVVSGAVAGAVTFGVGQSAIAYYIEEKNIDQARETYKKRHSEYKRKKNVDEEE